MFRPSYGNLIVPSGGLVDSVQEGVNERVEFALETFIGNSPEVFEKQVEILRFRGIPEDYHVASRFSDWLCTGMLSIIPDSGLNVIVDQHTQANPLWGIRRVSRRTSSDMPTVILNYVLGGNLGYRRIGNNNTARLSLQIIDPHFLLERPYHEVSTIELPSGILHADYEMEGADHDEYEIYEEMYA